MGRRQDPLATAFLVGGVLAIIYGLFVGRLIDWVLERDPGTGFYIVCIAVGLLAAVLGLGRKKGWSDHF